MNKVIESFKNSKFSQLLGQPIKSFFSIVNQVDVPGIEDEDKYRYSLTKEDRMLDDELLNALKDVKAIEKRKKEFDSLKERKNVIEKSNESVPEVDYSKSKVEYELNMDERAI